MRPESDALGEPSPTESAVPRTHADPPTSNRTGTPKPFIGGYYWLPSPASEGLVWSVVTCQDLRCGPDDGHDAELWPRLMVPLASAWKKDARVLTRKLALSYAGLPRGRVTRPERTYLVLHGEDSPVPGWEKLVIAGFRLSGRRVKFVFDEHETMIPGHPRTVEAALGIRLSTPTSFDPTPPGGDGRQAIHDP